jgi:hypothetical protein
VVADIPGLIGVTGAGLPVLRHTHAVTGNLVDVSDSTPDVTKDVESDPPNCGPDQSQDSR